MSEGSSRISGYELARRVLDHPYGGIAGLLSLAGNSETEWLELKACMLARPEERLHGENDADSYWHVASAVIALANTRGGAVIVGVSDDARSVPGLEAGDLRGIIQKEGLEAYRRKEILERIDPPNGQWATGRRGLWRLDGGRLPQGQVEVRGMRHQGREVAVILVKPVEESCLRVWNENVEQILFRRGGQLGKNERVLGSRAMRDYETSRRVHGEDLWNLWESFLGKRQVRIFISSPGDVIEERRKAREVIERLGRTFAGEVSLCPVFWEDLPLAATASFQEGIDFLVKEKGGIDIAVFILWSRLGTSPGSGMIRPDGLPYQSGTEREFDLMLQAREASGHKRPEILVYKRDDEAAFEKSLADLDPSERAAAIEQKRRLQRFMQSEFHDAESGENIRAFLSFDSPRTFSEALERHLKTKIGEIIEQEILADIWEGPPYRGLEVFTEKESPIFFGREGDAAVFLQHLESRHQNARPLLVILGPSGSGKSSFLQAGVLRRLREHPPAALARDWRFVIATPSRAGRDPAGWLGLAFSQEDILPELRNLLPHERVQTEARADFAAFIRLAVLPAIERESGRIGRKAGVVLVLDQLEEMFTSGDPNTLRGWVNCIEIISRHSEFLVVGTLRSDYYAEVQRSPGLQQLLGADGCFLLDPPQPEELHRIISLPARMAGYRFEDAPGMGPLDRRILKDLNREVNALPLLEYLLAELARRASAADKLMRHSDYESLGGLAGAIGSRAEEVFQGLSCPKAADEVFATLVTSAGPDGNLVAKRKAPLKEILSCPNRRTFVHAFIEARLFLADEDSVSVAHESLFTHWERLARWIRSHQQALATRHHIEEQHALWLKNHRNSDFLVHGRKPVAFAEDLLLNHGTFLDQDVAEYVKLSIRHEQRGQRIWKVAALLLLLTSAGLLAMSAYAFHAQNEARNEAANARDSVRQRQEELSLILSHLNPLLSRAIVGSDLELRVLAIELYDETKHFWKPELSAGENIHQLFQTFITCQLQANSIVLKHVDHIFRPNSLIDETIKLELGKAMDFAIQMEGVAKLIYASGEYEKLAAAKGADVIKMLNAEYLLAQGAIQMRLGNHSEATTLLTDAAVHLQSFVPPDQEFKEAQLTDQLEIYTNLVHANRWAGDLEAARASAQDALDAGLKLARANPQKRLIVVIRFLFLDAVGLASPEMKAAFEKIIQDLGSAERATIDQAREVFRELEQ